jgi:glycosyltransferase involved in cell wall biosynthesis
MRRPVRVIWHDHCGRRPDRPANSIFYRPVSWLADGVIAVNERLAAWAKDKLRCRPDRVWYVPNFSGFKAAGADAPAVPGPPGKRIVAVANLRPQKDHLTLLKALAAVAGRVPDAHLCLVGRAADPAYAHATARAIHDLGLESNVTVLGERTDVPQILEQCDIGELSSATEGLPLALIEYGAAGLAAVATDVGQCSEVLGAGSAGLIVPPGDHAALADALTGLLRDRDRREQLGARLRARVADRYSASAAIRKVCDIYDAVLAG